MSPFRLAVLSVALLVGCAPADQEVARVDESSSSPGQPLVELDHVFVIVQEPESAVAALTEAGITIDPVGSLMPHDGQGTASVNAAFENAYLEILWADTRVPLAQGAEDGIAHFPEAARWEAGGPSPFGVGLRRRTPGSGALPYDGAEVEGEEWVEEGQTFFAFQVDDAGPKIFVVPDYMAMPSWRDDFRQANPQWFVHESGVSELSHIRIAGVSEPASLAEAAIPNIRFGDPGAAPLLELTFDDGAAGITQDLRPGLPIVIHR